MLSLIYHPNAALVSAAVIGISEFHRAFPLEPLPLLTNEDLEHILTLHLSLEGASALLWLTGEFCKSFEAAPRAIEILLKQDHFLEEATYRICFIHSILQVILEYPHETLPCLMILLSKSEDDPDIREQIQFFSEISQDMNILRSVLSGSRDSITQRADSRDMISIL